MICVEVKLHPINFRRPSKLAKNLFFYQRAPYFIWSDTAPGRRNSKWVMLSAMRAIKLLLHTMNIQYSLCPEQTLFLKIAQWYYSKFQLAHWRQISIGAWEVKKINSRHTVKLHAYAMSNSIHQTGFNALSLSRFIAVIFTKSWS